MSFFSPPRYYVSKRTSEIDVRINVHFVNNTRWN